MTIEQVQAQHRLECAESWMNHAWAADVHGDGTAEWLAAACAEVRAARIQLRRAKFDSILAFVAKARNMAEAA